MCKTKEPVISEELTEYIVGAYAYELLYYLIFLNFHKLYI